VRRFPSSQKTPITDDEKKAVDNLIDAMDLDELDRYVGRDKLLYLRDFQMY
jgi:hypothetical protein